MSFCPLTKKACDKDCEWYITGSSFVKDHSECAIKVLTSNTAIIMDILTEKVGKK
jgi:hypothetical protein